MNDSKIDRELLQQEEKNIEWDDYIDQQTMKSVDGEDEHLSGWGAKMEQLKKEQALQKTLTTE